jgi:hypothetical protein
MYSLAITIDGKIAVGGGQDSVLKVWNVENTQVIRSFDPPKPKAPEPGGDLRSPAGLRRLVLRGSFKAMKQGSIQMLQLRR